MELEQLKSNDSALDQAFAQASLTLHKDYLAMLDDDGQVEIKKAPSTILEQELAKKSRFYKIKKLTYNQEEDVLEKLATVFNANYYYEGTLALMIQSNEGEISYYLGTINKEPGQNASTSGKLLKSAFEGNFPGSELELMKNSAVKSLFGSVFDNEEPYCISAVSGIASDKIDDLAENEKFVQGMEKLIDATKEESYTLLILADPMPKEQIRAVRGGYETLYSQLAPFEKTEMTFNSTDSLTLTEGTSENVSEATSSSETNTVGSSKAKSTSKSETDSKTKSGLAGTIGRMASAVGGLGVGAASISAIPGAGGTLVGGLATKAVAGAVGAVGMPAAAAAVAGTIVLGAVLSGSSESKSKTESSSETDTKNYSTGITVGETHTVSSGTNSSEAKSQSQGQSVQITSQNRSVKSLLEKIDLQLERLEQCESFGTFRCAAYVISNNPSTNHIVASMYNALMRGEESAAETSQVNLWKEEGNVKAIAEYLSHGYHPEFSLKHVFDTSMIVTPASVVSGRELAIHMGLPKKSVPGLPVVEAAEFGRNVYNPNRADGPAIQLGKIYHMGKEEEAEVQLDLQSMSMHTFITGSTGTGKSNTVYQLLHELENQGVGFLIIEPAKGEYKHMFGNQEDVHVFGTNPYYMPLLKVNPFKFPEGIHVLEHVDRLVEIFNVCWPMYAAMPAVLKDAVLRAYEASGWDLITSVNADGPLFPTFADVLRELDYVINHSAYSSDTKGDYIGSLATRLNSLTNGLNGQIFVSDEVDNHILFDSKTIVDLSRVGSLETKALLMGVLVMRLSEHRMACSEGMNQPLRHVTVLEEAHNILKRTSTEQSMEGANMAGKSVEMISNAIAEMRTYGEGFIIADQSPNAIDISAIRNTNTKIIMRLPDEDDRQLAGRAAALKDEQLDEIAKLPKGVAVVYQNDWLEPVLCKIHKYEGQETLYQYMDKEFGRDQKQEQWFKQELLKLLVKGRVNEKIDVDIDKLQQQVLSVNLSTKLKRTIRDLLESYRKNGDLELWQDKNFASLSVLVEELLHCKNKVDSAVKNAKSFDELNRSLANIIQQQVPGSSDKILLTVAQCLMNRFRMEKVENIPIYKEWYENIFAKGVL